MLRRLTVLLQAKTEAKAAASSTGASGTTPAKRKAKWIDRRSKKLIRNNGKDVWNFPEQPSCALCHVRFRYKQDYQIHKESTMHKDRVRWTETQTWYAQEGQQRMQRAAEEEWAWYVDRVLKPEAAASGAALTALMSEARRAVIADSPRHNVGVDNTANGRTEVVEPRDQRWPGSIKQ